jgi:hypothetical protein
LTNGPFLFVLFSQNYLILPYFFCPFTDVRLLQSQLQVQGVELRSEADESTTGFASFMAMDPDGDPILVDSHG